MEIQKAIEQFNEFVKMGYSHFWLPSSWSIKLAIEALEKQMPYKPKNEVNPEYPALGRNYYCKCGVMFMDKATNYCGNCGIKLDWGE